jgi:ABC-type branched-subunit amino acid transport system substrate-binding protein
MAVIACAIAVSACASGSGTSVTTTGKPTGRLNVYSGIPLPGPEPMAIEAGLRFGFHQLGNRVGAFRIVYRAMDDSAHRSAGDDSKTAAAASRVATDPHAAFYVGDFSASANAVSEPILAQAGIPQLSPAPGSASHPPTSFLDFQTGSSVQADAVGLELKQTGCKRIVITSPSELQSITALRAAIVNTLRRGYGGTSVANQALPDALSVYGQEQQTSAVIARLTAAGAAHGSRAAYDQLQSNIVHLEALQQIAEQMVDSIGVNRADCTVIAGSTTTSVVTLALQIHGINPSTKIFGEVSSCTGDGQTLLPSLGCISPGIPLSDYAGTASFISAMHLAKQTPNLYSLYGAQAAQAFVAAAQDAGSQAASREALVDALNAGHDRVAVVQRYTFLPHAQVQIAFAGVRQVKLGRTVRVEIRPLVPYLMRVPKSKSSSVALSDASDAGPSR